eukprot:scaffold24571_cov57-Phaeocystis_antarctica.AAC.5
MFQNLSAACRTELLSQLTLEAFADGDFVFHQVAILTAYLLTTCLLPPTYFILATYLLPTYYPLPTYHSLTTLSSTRVSRATRCSSSSRARSRCSSTTETRPSPDRKGQPNPCLRSITFTAGGASESAPWSSRSRGWRTSEPWAPSSASVSRRISSRRLAWPRAQGPCGTRASRWRILAMPRSSRHPSRSNPNPTLEPNPNSNPNLTLALAPALTLTLTLARSSSRSARVRSAWRG